MKLIGPLVLLALVSLVEGEVVKDSFLSCRQFFMDGAPPTGLTDQIQNQDQNHSNRYKQICQKYKGEYRFATLYDTLNRIPVYSAYQYRGHDKVDRDGWMIEPQLDLLHGSSEWTQGAEMTTEGSYTHNGIWGKHQALNIDYNEQKVSEKYEKGHLYPHCHNCDQAQAESTFTLTNAAPQNAEDNKDWYGQVEKVTANMIDNWCQQDTAHVVTGVVPGDQSMMSNTASVNVPNYFWSAVCCICRENSKTHLSQGFLAATKTGMEKIKGKHPGQGWKMVAKMMPVATLNKKLSELYSNSDFKVFGNTCQNSLKNKLKNDLGLRKNDDEELRHKKEPKVSGSQEEAESEWFAGVE